MRAERATTGCVVALSGLTGSGVRCCRTGRDGGGVRCWSVLAGEPPDLVLLGGQGAAGVAGPLVDEGARCGGDGADVDALAAVYGDELVVVAVAERGHRSQLVLLVGAAVAG